MKLFFIALNFLLLTDYSFAQDQMASEQLIKSATSGRSGNGSCEYDRICIGSKVLYQNSIREVETIDESGRIFLWANDEFFRSIVSKSEVTKIVSEFGGYKSGTKVLHGDSIREVEVVDNTGRIVLKEASAYAVDDFLRIVQVELNGYFRTFTTSSEISKIVQSNKGFTAGDTVIFKNSIRQIKAVDNTDRIVLKETDGVFGRTFTRISAISKGIESTANDDK